MKRGYSPRLSTADLIGDIASMAGVARVQSIAPTHTAWGRSPTRVKVTLDSRSGDGTPISTVFTLAEARKWLANEKEAGR